MARPMQVMWYINPNDGPFPWSPKGRIKADLMRSREIAVTLDRRGFYGTLTVGRAPLVETASWIPITKTLRFLIPIYPGVTPPMMLAQQAKNFDSISGGRFLLNQVNGTDNILKSYGVDVPSDERYEMSEEYWTLFKRLYASDLTPYEGKYFHYAGAPINNLPAGTESDIWVQDPHTPIWGSGNSPAAVRQAGELLDVFLAHMFRPDRLNVLFQEARTLANARGRTLKTGVLANIIVRKTEAEAWDHARWVLEQTGAEQIVRQIEGRLKTGRYNPALGTREPGGFETLTSDDPMIKARLDALRNGRVPDVRALESYPNVWAGPTSWGALDVLEQGWGSWLVGSAEGVAARMREMQEVYGIDAFILAGWPSLEEVNTVADLLLPLLELDTEPPKLMLSSD